VTTKKVAVAKGKFGPDFMQAKTKHKDSPETAATAKAEMNFERARCLRFAVDFKIDQDIRAGKISDWGNVRVDGPCGKYKTK
jgi:hypothetical protein